MLTEELKIPHERIAVLIGKQASTKKRIEEATHTQLEIDSQEGIVGISGQEGAEQGFITATGVVKAIGRGFSPEKALKLLDDGYMLDWMDLGERVGKSRKTQIQKKGRIIGRKGKIRELIEQETDSYISVYGKTVGIIGKMESIDKARAAIEMLVQGATHTTLKKFLSRSGRVEKFSL